MKLFTVIFNNNNSSRGGMLIELLLSMALAMIVIPFIFRYHQDAVRRADNIAINNQMQAIGTALERYIVTNRDQLLRPVGKNITRVALSDLAEYGLDDGIIQARASDYQLRILKSGDFNNQATLQGVIILSDADISPLRTREIVNLSGEGAGFIDSGHAHGAYGTWPATAADLGLAQSATGIVETTAVTRDNAKYLWRKPSQDVADATMLAPLNLGGHDIGGASFFNARTSLFDETLTAKKIVSSDLIFQNRTSIDKDIVAANSTVSGILSSDGKNLEVAGNFSLADLAKFSSFTVGDLYVSNMTLGGISISDTGKVATLKINQSLDMTSGRIDALFVTVGFAGSITPRLQVRKRIEDSIKPQYYWDAQNRVANFFDATLVELSRMAQMAVARSGTGTSASQIFGAVSANKNATAADFMNAITEIQKTVRTKYRQLNL